MSVKFEPFNFFDRQIWLLRDDLIDGDFNGNKARKLEHFLKADLSGIKRIVSCGSSQSNAMYSLSVFARKKGLEFCYVVSHLSSNLAANPIGNFKFALKNSMKLYICEDRRKFALSLASDKDALFIEEGVAMSEAECGFKTQATQIKEWAKEMGFISEKESLNLANFKAQKEAKILDIFLPSGTGASATYLAKNLNFNVFSTPCVGDMNYLKDQIKALHPSSKVKILPPPKKYHFGKLYPELYEIWLKIFNETGVEFDLIYDPVGLLTLKANLHKFKNEILYIHQGGTLGNISQKARYERKIKIC